MNAYDIFCEYFNTKCFLKQFGHIGYVSDVSQSKTFHRIHIKNNLTSEETMFHFDVISQYSDAKSSFPNEIPRLKPSLISRSLLSTSPITFLKSWS